MGLFSGILLGRPGFFPGQLALELLKRAGSVAGAGIVPLACQTHGEITVRGLRTDVLVPFPLCVLWLVLHSLGFGRVKETCFDYLSNLGGYLIGQ